MTLTAMLLVGGKSRRMGTDKALLVVEGEPLWQRQLCLLREVDTEAIWVSARARPSWCPEGVDVVLDEPPSRGPLSGLVAGLSRLQTSHLLALAIDMPKMSSEHLKKLVGRVQPGRGVVPANGGWYEPLCAVYPSETVAIACRELKENRFSLQGLVGILQENGLIEPYAVQAQERQFYFNANTPFQS